MPLTTNRNDQSLLNLVSGVASAVFQQSQFSNAFGSLQTQLTKRFSGGLAFTSALTWGKGLNYIAGNDGGLMFFINMRRNYAPTDFDRTLNFERSFTYALPAGRGNTHFNSGVGDAVLGGWKLTGVISIVSGLPFTVNGNRSSLNTPGTNQTGSINGNLKVLHNIGPGKQWFDASNIIQPTGCSATPCAAPSRGNPGRNQFRGPGYLQDTFSV